MLNAIDWTIEAVTYGSLLLLATQFIRYCWQRAANKSAAAKFWGTIDREFWQTNLAPRQPEPAALTYAPKTTAQPATLVIRNEPDLSDEALIRWAKSMQFPGSSKWSFRRRLSQKVRSELLGLMEG